MARTSTDKILYIGIILILIIAVSYRVLPVESFQEAPRQKPKGIILELIGGLGNQLYIYSAGYAMYKALDIPIYLKLDTASTFIHTKIDYRPILFSEFNAINNDDIIMNDTIDVKLQNDVGDSWSIDRIPMNNDKYIRITGQWFQYFPAISTIIPEIRKKICNILQNKYSEIVLQPNSAFIHIRRGDYTDKNNHVFLLDMDYYLKALPILNEEDDIKNIYIFSDEISWCKQQKWDTSKNLLFIDEADELKTLYMMSQCKEGAIIANSTFSTWGAILGSYENNNIIVYPSKWLYGIKTEFPSDWIKI